MTDFRTIDVGGRERVTPASQPAPQLQWVKIADLVIDGRYQRPLGEANWIAIRRIAQAFRWSRFGPVLVAPVEGGQYALIDGQHRAHAAALCGFEAVPAMIAMVAPEEQALAFIEINTRQIRVHRLAVYRAALLAGEDWAIRCRDAVEAAGCQLMTSNRSTKDKKPGQVFAVSLIRRLVDGGGAAAVINGLAALLEYDPEAVANFSDVLLTPWLTAVAQVPRDVPDLVRVLHSRRPWLVIEAANRLAKADGIPAATARRNMFTMLIRKGGLPDAV
ncbi:MAG: ParB N-terminal domain-containing protein [Paracoccus sp. (in: a-proteobacteria)]|nr:ParB N-terminal domain-containing protein [Paracoccus sp. (in: a-proteobacteria)]